ncbi:MAG: M61 family metallopeptidase [Terriglobia bacterium]
MGRLRNRCFISFLVLCPGVLLYALTGAAQPIQYVVDLTQPESHLVRVTMTIPEAHRRTRIQFPAWNALYQIRDFVRNVQDLRAQCDGRSITLAPVDLYTWTEGNESCASLRVRYNVYANQPGVFSSELGTDHAFLNLAEVLFYLPGGRDVRDQVRFILPAGWKLVTLMAGNPAMEEYSAPGYDAMVDSPVEAGLFQTYSYSQGGATYRVVVRADSEAYSSTRLLDAIKKITATETALMDNVPFSRYTFIFHFPPASGGGGMEHSNGSAISFPSDEVDDNFEGLENIIAHEFFHLWNVKRIRPAGLEPVDYIHGNDTRDLWFSEGFTSAVAELTLLRAGLITREDFYEDFAYDVEQLQRRPARHFQSVELAGMDAWLEKYPDYARPGRSISYYNKGELLGDLLDLAMRHASGNHHGLEDLMKGLNVKFAQHHRCFTDADLERIIALLAPPPTWVNSFFQNYIYGTAELDYDKYLGYAGLRLVREEIERPDWGIEAVPTPRGLIQVVSVRPASHAAAAGLSSGDILLELNGQVLYASPEQVLGLRPGEKVKLRVRRGSQLLSIHFNLGSRTVVRYSVKEMPRATAEQLATRQGWLYGRTSGPGDGAVQ